MIPNLYIKNAWTSPNIPLTYDKYGCLEFQELSCSTKLQTHDLDLHREIPTDSGRAQIQNVRQIKTCMTYTFPKFDLFAFWVVGKKHDNKFSQILV